MKVHVVYWIHIRKRTERGVGVTRYLVLDIGGTFIKYAVMTQDAQIELQGKVPSDTSAEEGLLASMRQIRATLDDSYEGVAVSMPGRIGTEDGVAHTGGAFTWIREYPAAQRFGEVFDKPVTIANDGKCAAYAESWLGALSDVDSGAVIVLGTGIGGGIVLNHEVLMGATGGAGELSLFLADFDSAKNGAALFSSNAIWTERISAKTLSRQFATAKGLDTADGVMLFNAYDEGDEDAKRILDEFAKQAAAGILSLQSVLDLSRYAIGGGISARPETTSFVRDAVDALFDPAASFLPFGKPEIVTCKFGNEANLIGALAFHLRSV